MAYQRHRKCLTLPLPLKLSRNQVMSSAVASSPRCPQRANIAHSQQQTTYTQPFVLTQYIVTPPK